MCITSLVITWFLAYIYLADFTDKLLAKRTQIHSIIHSVVAFLWTTWILCIYLPNNVLTTNFAASLQGLTDDQQIIILMSIYHSTGYFLADTYDILFVDWKNKKRRIYIPHHLAALIGISTVCYGSYLPVYAIWCLEVGAIVHHLKRIVEMYDCRPMIRLMTQVLYHVVYVSSRILLGLNVINAIQTVQMSETVSADIMGLIMAVILLIQSGIWWIHNARKSLITNNNK